eukprot:gene25788-11455_t
MQLQFHKQAERPGIGPKGVHQPRHIRVIPHAVPKPTTPTTPSPVNEPAMEQLLSWAKETAAIDFKHIVPAIFPDTGRGLTTKEPLKADSVILSVPRDSAITLAPRQKCPFPTFVQSGDAYWDKTPWHVALAVMLLYHKQENGFLKPYSESLPKKVEEQRQDWAAYYAALQAGLQPGKEVAEDEFYWAMSCVRSRTFSGPYVGSTLKERGPAPRQGPRVSPVLVCLPFCMNSSSAEGVSPAFRLGGLGLIAGGCLKQYAMCPVVDFLNHSSSVASEVSYDYFAQSYTVAAAKDDVSYDYFESEVSYDYFADSYTVAAAKEYQPGDQILVTYGQDNDGLMQYYGFAEVANTKEDTYVMGRMMEWVKQCADPPQSRIDEAAKDGVLDLLKEVVVSRKGFPPPILQCLRYLLASGDDAAKSIADFVAPGSDALESRMAQILVQACTLELKSLGPSMHPGAEGPRWVTSNLVILSPFEVVLSLGELNFYVPFGGCTIMYGTFVPSMHPGAAGPWLVLGRGPLALGGS